MFNSVFNTPFGKLFRIEEPFQISLNQALDSVCVCLQLPGRQDVYSTLNRDFLRILVLRNFVMPRGSEGARERARGSVKYAMLRRAQCSFDRKSSCNEQEEESAGNSFILLLVNRFFRK
ncbi:unnamed protein product [Sphagnum balticum]